MKPNKNINEKDKEKNGIKKTVTKPKKTTNNETRSNNIDRRPIRNVSFQLAAQTKLITFLQDTGYLATEDKTIFKDMTTSDLKSIFEHLIKLICPTFRLNEQKQSWDKVIANFLSAFNYKASLTMSHMNAPTLKSSVPFVLSAMDYLRRLARTHINCYPSMMFPKIEGFDISTEFILNYIIEMKKEAKENLSYLEMGMEKFRKNLQCKAGVMSDEEKIEREQRLVNIEKIVLDNVAVILKIKEINRNAELVEALIDEKASTLKSAKISKEKLCLEILSLEKKLKFELDEKSKVNVKVANFAEMRYDEKLNTFNEYNDKIRFIQNNNMNWRSKIDDLREQLRMLDKEVDVMKLHAQTKLIEVNHLFDVEFKAKICDFGVEDLLMYDSTLRPLFYNLNNKINNEIETKSIVLASRKAECDAEEMDYLALAKELERSEVENTKLVVSSEKILEERKEREKEVDREEREYDELCDLLKQEEEELLNIELENIKLKEKLTNERQLTQDSKGFYEADILLRNCIAELRLQSCVEDYELHKELMDIKKERIKWEQDYIEAMKKENDKLESDALEYFRTFRESIQDD